MDEDFRMSLAQERHDARRNLNPDEPYDDSDYWHEFHRDEKALAREERARWAR